MLKGPSGSGKTTLLAMIGCLSRPTAGRITLDGRLLSNLPERFMTEVCRSTFGYRLRYFIGPGAQRLGCVLLAGAARTIAVRDGWIGWSAQARRRNLPCVVNNSRFLTALKHNPAAPPTSAGAGTVAPR